MKTETQNPIATERTNEQSMLDQSSAVSRTSDREMHANGWRKMGWTNDPSILQEVRRDFLTQSLNVAFTHGSAETFQYWIKD